jgi:hypothetical protein
MSAARRAPVVGRAMAVLAKVDQRDELQPRRLLRSRLRDRASSRGVGGWPVVARTRDGTLQQEQLRQIHALPERVG